MEPVTVSIPRRKPGDTNDHIRDAMEEAAEGGNVIRSIGFPSSRARNLPVQATGKKAFQRMGENDWLQGRAKCGVYQLLIDNYRLRVIQDQQGEGRIAEPVYHDDPIGGFKSFLEKVEAKRGLLVVRGRKKKRKKKRKKRTDRDRAFQDLRRAKWPKSAHVGALFQLNPPKIITSASQIFENQTVINSKAVAGAICTVLSVLVDAYLEVLCSKR